jgi:kinesin family protein 5
MLLAIGIIPRAVEALFNGVLEADENVEFTFKVSYVEIYMEKIRDLLDDNRLKTNLTVREDKIKGIYIAGVTEEYVTSHEELLGIMASGAANRAVAATGMNEGSSRSHSVFTITVSQKDLSNNTTKSGKLVLVDLAGSEMVRKSNASGQQLEEAKTINKSLSALGQVHTSILAANRLFFTCGCICIQVINALTDEKQTHVPYRDSKLTRILQDSLGGNAKTVLITAVSPSSFNANETVSTLRFGMRAKSIENKVTVNQTRSVEELEGLLMRAEKAIDTQNAHIAAITAQLQALQLAGAAGGLSIDGSNVAGNSAAAAAAIAAAEAARVEAEGVVDTMQEQVAQLQQELDEERAESKRKDGEMQALTQIVRDKERLLIEAGEILQEAQRHYEAQRDRAEQLVREKADAVGELESLKGTMSEELAKSNFNLQELEVTVETLRKENQQLQIEISELSGDAVEQRETTKPKDSTPAKSTKATDRSPAHQQQTAISFGDDSADNDTVPQKSAASGALFMDAPLSSAERSKLLQDVLNQLSAVCAKYGISVDASSEIAGILRSQASASEALSLSFEAKIALNDNTAGEQGRRIRDMEVQRQRLEKDLAGRTEKLAKLQFEMDALRGMDGVSASEYLTERERAHMRSLQQRLEQLVVVHRQLLRKFASLELENGEFRKKITLRDERIKQLESNSRGLTGNMRQQAERHVAELTNLREQIQILRTEHMQRMEAKEHQQAAPVRTTGTRTSKFIGFRHFQAQFYLRQ